MKKMMLWGVMHGAGETEKVAIRPKLNRSVMIDFKGALLLR